MNDIKQVVLNHAIAYRDWLQGLSESELRAHANIIKLFPMDDLEPEARGIISGILEGRMSPQDLEGVRIHSDQMISAMKGLGFYDPPVVAAAEECLDILFIEDPDIQASWKGIQDACILEVEGSEIPPMVFDIEHVNDALNNVMAEVRRMSA